MDIAKREYWTRQLEEFKKSDLTVAKWCAENKVILSSFKYYKHKLSGGASKKEETAKFERDKGTRDKGTGTCLFCLLAARQGDRDLSFLLACN